MVTRLVKYRPRAICKYILGVKNHKRIATKVLYMQKLEKYLLGLLFPYVMGLVKSFMMKL